jgi:L-seryl-tRNA(Ser) seleniumtransferase
MVVSDTHIDTETTAREWLDELGLRPVINAAATLTRLGGSLMPPPVVEAMAAGARTFVDVPALQRAVGRRIAELTHNEAAYISSGAAGGIVVSVASCLAGTDGDRIDSFPHLTGFDKTEIIVHTSQRNGYDYAARMTGATFVEIEGTPEALEGAITGRTGAVLWFAGAHFAEGALPIEQVIEIAHRRDVPVIVDAAAQVPAIENLWHFTRDLGADIAVFSGGKGLRGPQSSGLVLGRPDLIEGCIANGSPNYSIGRPMKVGKEELFGILAAVEWSLAQDEPSAIAAWEGIVQMWVDGLQGIPGVTVERGYPSEAGQPHSRAIVTLGPDAAMDRDRLIAALWNGEPSIAVGEPGPGAIALNPQTVTVEEAEIVLKAVRDALTEG